MRLSKSITIAALIALIALSAQCSLAADNVTDKIDWPRFLSRSDMLWKKMPIRWNEGAFMGNGLLGANVFATNLGQGVCWRIGRTDVVYQGNRIPIGEMVLKTVGKITGAELQLSLWNAELCGNIHTDRGIIEIRSFTHAHDLVQLVELRPDAGEANASWEWQPGLAANPRSVYQKTKISENDKNPEPRVEKSADVNLSIQPLKNGMEHATAWKEISGDWGRRLYLSVGWGKTGEGAKEAVKTANAAAAKPIEELTRTHLEYWHNYWPESFVSIPDARMESFYWIQMYKLASATREGRPPIDLLGPWFNTTPWPKIWWNLNIQLTYWPVLASNRLELGKPLCKMIDDGAAALEKNAAPYSDDSSTIGRSASYDCVRAAGEELCDFPWVMHNYYLQYRYTMDDQMLREHLFPMLKRAINYYFHFIKTESDGKLHITRGYSPEYPGQGTPNPDCNINLALIRWGCQTLLEICDRLKIDDPLVPKWKDTLANLTPYPTDSNGLKISASVPFAQSHRHYSHLLMIYPLYIMNPEQPENRELVTKSLTHWMGMPQALKGYSYTGASSISSLMASGEDAAMYLNKLLDSKMIPANTLYAEAGPCIETPLSAAASVHDMLLSSWGHKIRVFPAIPNSWKDVAIENMRTEGAFLVTATRKGGKTQFVRIESLAGEPCRLITDLEQPVVAPAADGSAAASAVKIKSIGPREYELDLKNGQTLLLVPAAGGTDLTVAPVESKGSSNFYGLH